MTEKLWDTGKLLSQVRFGCPANILIAVSLYIPVHQHTSLLILEEFYVH